MTRITISVSTASTTLQTRSPLQVEGTRPFIVAGIPAYDEEKNIAKVITSIKKYVDKVIVCDDGSKDMTAEIAGALGVEVIRHGQNMGYGAALASLFKRAREVDADVMVTIDGDDQHNPADIPMLTRPITSGEADIVIGSRFSGGDSKGVPRYRKLGIVAITRLSQTARPAGDASLTDAQSGLRAYGRRALEVIRPSEMGMGASTEILTHAWDAQLSIKEVPVKIAYHSESSTHNPLYHGVDVILSTVKHLSIKHPLIFYGLPGILFFVVALCFSWWDLTIFVESRRLVTNITLVALFMGVVGLILMAVAVMLWVLISVIRGKN
jgi:glycosyltransferase involved in cell wall biosynthesis